MRTKSMLFVAASAFAGWMTTGTVFAGEGTGDTASGTQKEKTAKAPTATTAQLIKATAKVESVDLDKHELTLKAAKGKPFTISVPESVTRLDNVKSGDTVHISFYESIAVSLQKPGSARVGEQKETMNQRAPGTLPGGMAIEQTTTTAKITKVDHANDELTIETPSGKANTLQVTDPQIIGEMKNLKVGDQIQTTYTTAMATSVEPRKHM